MIYLTILNTLLITYIFLDKSKYYFRWHNKRSSGGKYLGFSFSLWRRSTKHSSSLYKTIFKLNIRDYKHVEMQEDAERLKSDKVNQSYSLRAIFSWYKTQEEVDQFKKYYSEVNPELVNQLVDSFEFK